MVGGSVIRFLSLATAAAALQLPARGSRSAPSRMQFGDFKNPFANKRDGATTVSITFSFQCADRGPKSVLGQLDALAAGADTSTADGFSALCADTALMLLRREGEWLACCGTSEHSRDDDTALANFDRLAIREAAKFEDRSTGATIDSALAAAGVGGAAGAKASPPTMDSPVGWTSSAWISGDSARDGPAGLPRRAQRTPTHTGPPPPAAQLGSLRWRGESWLGLPPWFGLPPPPTAQEGNTPAG